MATQAQNNGTNVIIKDVELHWVKLDKPVSPFGVEQFEISVQVPKKRSTELAVYGTVKPVKDRDGKDTGRVGINLKKKAFKKDGTEAAKVRVVDTKKEAIDSKIIGNGSKGNVMVYLQDYQIKAPNGKVTKEGTSAMLIAVQVTDLIRYEPKSDNFTDFDYDGQPTASSTADDVEAIF